MRTDLTHQPELAKLPFYVLSTLGKRLEVADRTDFYQEKKEREHNPHDQEGGMRRSRRQQLGKHEARSGNEDGELGKALTTKVPQSGPNLLPLLQKDFIIVHCQSSRQPVLVPRLSLSRVFFGS